jgi:hypothetical protein
LDEAHDLEDHDEEHEDKDDFDVVDDDDTLDVSKLNDIPKQCQHCHRVGHIALHYFDLSPCSLF